MRKEKQKTLSVNEEISDIIIYKGPNNNINFEVFLFDENVWLTQKKIAELFGTTKQNISLHIKNILETNELDEKSTVKEFLTVQKEGNRKIKRNQIFYDLNMIISIGYKVNSSKATQFRIWATNILKEYIIKGFVMDDKRLKNPKNIFGKDYFEEQLERIRDIRSSERRFYQKITDIYSQCSADYDPKSSVTENFFALVQNKMHFSITGETAAEIVYNRASSKKENMGLTTWKNAPKGKIRKNDVSTAKNYLDKNELDELNRIVSMYLDFAEMQAKKNKLMNMKDWVKKLDAFLKFNEREILNNLGDITQKLAKEFAESEFKKYKKIQDKLFVSDFDKLNKKIGEK